MWNLSTTNKPVVNPNLRAQVTSKIKFPHSLAAKASLRGQNSQDTGHLISNEKNPLYLLACLILPKCILMYFIIKVYLISNFKKKITISGKQLEEEENWTVSPNSDQGRLSTCSSTK